MEGPTPPVRGMQLLLQESAVTQQHADAVVKKYASSSASSKPVQEFLHPRIEMTVHTNPVNSDADGQLSIVEDTVSNDLRYVTTTFEALLFIWYDAFSLNSSAVGILS